jgi:5-methylcytosine-specific restriction endonuclease McrA
MSSRRRFTLKQRVAMRWIAGGENAICALCGDPLPEGWHADHRTPWIRGGPTLVSNADVTCARCNLRKGARYGSSPMARKSSP